MTASEKIATTLAMRDVAFAYRASGFAIEIAGFELAPGERAFLRGPSGSGKTTFLALAAGLLAADTGSVVVGGRAMPDSPAARDRLRADAIGIIHQQFNLLGFLDTLSNVLMPVAFGRGDPHRARTAAEALLLRLGIPSTLHARPAATLSIGQQQRVAIARALLGGPALVVADEPTSALDVETRDAFLDLLFEATHEAGSALLMVSHDPAIGARFERSVDLRDIAVTSQARAA